MKSSEDLKGCVRRICELLEYEYGMKHLAKTNPIDTLVLTILSQTTNFKNCKSAYEGLIAEYKTWQDVLEAPEEDIAKAISIGGLGRIKARRIKNALSRIKEREGEVDLRFLAAMSTEDAMGFLLSMDGVGQKTAACVLCFSFDKPCFPVDTHIYRICKRLGLGGNSREVIASLIEETIAGDKLCAFHLNLIEHGRRICTARNPKCNDCVLKDYCY
ncbi:MAG TPA: Fe-S cluster assembly protein HesB [Methanophagales archaeon]|nr:Fe-S cluster assembly protein HesB [Methanophagales archaeon]